MSLVTFYVTFVQGETNFSESPKDDGPSSCRFRKCSGHPGFH